MAKGNDSVTEPSTHVTIGTSRADRKRLYLSARINGSSITEAARLAGVHRKTGHLWEKWRTKFESEQKALDAQRLLIATKDEVEAEMSRLIKEAEYPADRIKAAQVLNATRGYNAPTRSVNLNVTAPAGVMSWLDKLDERLLSNTTTPALDAHEPAALPPGAPDKAGES